MTVFLLAIADCYDPCRVTIPGQIIDSTANDVILSFRGPFANTIPYTDRTRDIAAGNIVAGRGKSGDGGCCGVR